MGIKDMFYRYRPQIMMGLGVVGVGATAVLAARATLVADKILNQKRRWNEDPNDTYRASIKEVVYAGDEEDRKTAIVEAAKELVPLYLPTVCVGLGTIGLFLGANHIQMNRVAAANALVGMSQEALHKYKDAVREKLGDRKLEELEDEIQQKEMEDREVDEALVLQTGYGDYLCYDSPSGRYFRSNMEAVRRAEVQMTKDLLMGPVSLNRFYEYLEIPDIPLGEYMGWDPNDRLLEVRFTTQISPSNEPTFVLDYDVYPLESRLGL